MQREVRELALQDVSPPGLNPLWACGHVVAHHPADRQTSLRVGSSKRLQLDSCVHPPSIYCDLTAGHKPH